ncbi:MAG: alpha/beta fold hydrolase [Proteobacteria bacterium]|nr:alpha/beta fold hydrolase [Pseudomonadota bacterium]
MLDQLLGASPLVRPAYSLMRMFARATAGVATHERMVHGVRWSWFEAGPSDGEPLVLLHGFAGSKDNWMLVAPLLARRYRVICPDLPGFGESGLVREGDYSIGEQANRVVQFIDALGIKSCSLGGNSMGGFIALTIALDAPDVVSALFLLNNAGVDGPQHTVAQESLKSGYDLFEVQSAEDVSGLLALLMHQPPPLPWLARRAIVAHLSHRHGIQRRIFDQILKDAVERPLNERLGEIAVPALIMWGRSDDLLHVSAAEFQHQQIAGAELVVLENAGHVPMLERPLRTAREMLSFGERLAARSA